MCLKIGHFGLKTRSLSRIREKPCILSRGHIFRLILIKLGQNVCLYRMSNEFENGSFQIKIIMDNVEPKPRSLGQIIGFAMI